MENGSFEFERFAKRSGKIFLAIISSIVLKFFKTFIPIRNVELSRNEIESADAEGNKLNNEDKKFYFKYKQTLHFVATMIRPKIDIQLQINNIYTSRIKV